MRENKNEKIILYLITILLIILVFMGAYIIYNMTSNNNTNQNNDMNQIENNQNNNSTDKNETNNDLKSNEKEEISNVDSKIVEKLQNRFWPFNYCEYDYTSSTNYGLNFGILYRNNKTLISELPSETRMNYVIHNIDLSNYEPYIGERYRFSNEEFKKIYYEMLDENTKYEPVETGAIRSVLIDGDWIDVVGVGGDIVGPGYFIENKFIKSEQKNDEIYLYEKVLIQYSPEEGDIKYYSNFDLQNSFSINEKLEDVFVKYSNQIPTYKHTFKIKNDNYIYYSVEKVNE